MAFTWHKDSGLKYYEDWRQVAQNNSPQSFPVKSIDGECSLLIGTGNGVVAENIQMYGLTIWKDLVLSSQQLQQHTSTSEEAVQRSLPY